MSAKRLLLMVGGFRELGYEDIAGAPSIVDARGMRVAEHKREVVSYLRNARSIVFSPGVNDDYFNRGRTVSGDTLRTDGTYVWAEWLADYVERYDVALPPEFEEHMRQRGWRPPEVTDLGGLQVPY